MLDQAKDTLTLMFQAPFFKVHWFVLVQKTANISPEDVHMSQVSIKLVDPSSKEGEIYKI